MFKNLNCLIDITNSDNFVFNYGIALIIEKLECSQTSKFPLFKMIRSWSFEKIF